MATIKCKACGRTYNYRSSELCPKCGAFNRPPRRMRVGFDSSGSVELQTEKEFARNARAAGPDDVCFEEQARKVRNSDTLISSETLDQLGEHLNKWGSRVEKWWTENSQKSTPVAKDSPLRDRKKGKSGTSKVVAIIAAVSVLVSLLGTIMESCESNLVQVVPDYPSASTEQIAPSEVYWSEEHRKAILDTYAVTEEVGMGEVFEWQDVKMWLGGWELSGGSGDNFMVVSVNSGDAFPEERLNECFLLWVDWDGTEWVYTPTKFQNSALIFNYLHADIMPEDALCWLIFNDFDENGNWTGKTTAVALVGYETYFGDGSQDYASTEEVVAWSEEDCKNLLSLYGVTDVVNMGPTFHWEGVNLWVDGWTMDGMDNANLTLSLNSNQPLSATSLERCFLVWAQDPNISWTHHPESYQDGKMFFTDFYDPLHEGIKLWLVCEHYDDNGFRSGATAVELH